MNTKVLLAFACVAVTAAQAAPYNERTDVTATTTQAAVKTAIDDNDNRGLALLIDDKVQPGRVVVSGVSRLAKAAGVRPGDVVQSVCTQPASARHVAKIQALLNGAETSMTIGNHPLVTSLPTASAKDDGRDVVTARPLQLKTSTGQVVAIEPGERIQEICVPIRTGEELTTVVAPFDWRSLDGGKVLGAWLPMDYVLVRPGQAGRVFVRLTNTNPPVRVWN